MQTFTLERIETPTGAMLLALDEAGRLRAADWESHRPRMERLLKRYAGGDVTLREAAPTSAAAGAFAAYFAGDLSAMTGLETMTGGTAFQRQVWAALRAIPVGEVLSYGALAARLGRPTAVRAVGLANGANPIAIAVPCHRVIGANGALTGYGGGLERKAWLLAHEGAGAKVAA